LKVVVAQRLVKRICAECEKVDDHEMPRVPRLDEYIEKTGWAGSVRFVKGSGRNRRGEECSLCRGTGFHGRIGIFEILLVNRKIRTLISKGAVPDEIRAEAIKEGFRSLWSTGLERALQGETTLGQVLYHVGKPDPVLEGLSETRHMAGEKIETSDLAEFNMVDESQIPTKEL
jgi:type IV pilus assembly protein PilB